MSIYAYWFAFILIAIVLAEFFARVLPWGRWSWLTRSLVTCLTLVGLIALTLGLVGITGTMSGKPFVANLTSVSAMGIMIVPWRLAVFERRWKEAG